MKQCEVCNKEIPEDYANLLCTDCYNAQVAENERVEVIEQETKEMPVEGKNGIMDEGYTENPQKDDREQWEANVVQFKKTGKFLWFPTRDMYEFIKDYCHDRGMNHPQSPRMGGKHIWMPQVVDVGCGSGAGANIISQEADVVWGIDKNLKSIEFAREIFTRIKNGIYYNSQLTFDNVDIVEDQREFQQFDVVVAIEIIEHIDDYKAFLENIIKKFARKDKGGGWVQGAGRTEWFISSPNRNHDKISNVQPGNKFHVREWRSQEFHAVLSEYFKEVEFFSPKGEPAEIENTHTPLLARCANPK